MRTGLFADKEAQMYTIEAVLAAGMIIAALFFVVASVPPDVTPAQDFAKVQLKRYGQDVLVLFSRKDTKIAGGLLEYTLYREWSDRAGGEDSTSENKWYHDNFTDSPEKQNMGLVTLDGNQNWTTQYLVMIGDNDSLYDGISEERTSYFALQDATTMEWLWPINNGTLYNLMPFTSGDNWKLDSYNSNSLTFEEEAKKRDYTVNMVWFEDDKGGVSSPVIVWVDKKLEDHDRVVTLNMSESEGQLNETLQFAEIGQGQYVVVDVDAKGGGHLYVVGSSETELRARYGDEGPIKGVAIHTIEKDEKYQVTFDKPAKGGYLICWGTGWGSWQWSDPVFVLVGKPGLAVGEFISPLEAVFRDLGFNLTALNDRLHSYIPENVEYNLYFLNSDGTIAHSYEGEMKIVNGNPTPGAVVVTIPVFATTDGSTYDTYAVKLVLWYK
ncbi:MAG: hypothetical protein KKI07_05160 [Euryarchaeota archaeon]|nr:hypothetical protein [Euryarchaeota archaeon]